MIDARGDKFTTCAKTLSNTEPIQLALYIRLVLQNWRTNRVKPSLLENDAHTHGELSRFQTAQDGRFVTQACKRNIQLTCASNLLRLQVGVGDALTS
jgi:hypothetical protein